MATIKAVLRKRKNKQNQYPIAIRITKNRKSSYFYIGQYIEEKYWDQVNQRLRSSHPNYLRINQLILTKLTSCNEKLIENEASELLKSIRKIKETILANKKLDFRRVAEIYLNSILSRKNPNQYITDKNTIEQFEFFCLHRDLEFSEIDTNLLRRFEVFLQCEKGLSKPAVVNYMVCLRAIYKLAISNNYADRNNYPFGKGKYQIKIPQSQKIGLTAEEVKKLETLEGITEVQQHALNVWLLSFYFAGISCTDVIQLKWSDLIDDRFYYRITQNSSLVSKKVPLKAQKLLAYYKVFKAGNEAFIFPELWDMDLSDEIRVRTRVKTVTGKFNRHLKIIALQIGLNKDLCMHMPRHNFSPISGDKTPLELRQKLNSDSSGTTPMLSLDDLISKELDDALNKILDF